jgi:hypothetical protein
VNEEWNNVLQFRKTTNMGGLPASELNFLKNRAFAEDVTEGSWDTKFGEAPTEFRMVAGALRPFPATLSPAKSNGRILYQFRHVFSSLAMIFSSPITDRAKLHLISN